MNDDLRRELEAAGSRSVPGPRPGFQAELEERLLAVARTARPTAPPSPRPRVRRWPPRRLAGGLAGAAALIVIAVIAGTLGAPVSPELELTGAVNTEVSLADGTTLVDPDGLLLPDGSVVRVGAGGFARIGDVVLRPGDVATVDAGRLRVRPGMEASHSGSQVPATGPPGRTTAPPTREPTPTLPAPSSSPSSSPPAGSGQPTREPPTPRPGGTASPTAGPGEPRSPTPTAETPGAGTPTPSATAAATLKLMARADGPSAVRVSWTGAAGARRYRLLAWVWRAGEGEDPVRSARRIIGEFTHPPDSPLSFRVGADVVRVRLLVIAFAADGSELARSNVARVAFGG